MKAKFVCMFWIVLVCAVSGIVQGGDQVPAEAIQPDAAALEARKAMAEKLKQEQGWARIPKVCRERISSQP